MFKQVKSRLLTKWFVEWVHNENDIETLEFTRQLIESRQDQIEPQTRVIGFQIPNSANPKF